VDVEYFLRCSLLRFKRSEERRADYGADYRQTSDGIQPGDINEGFKVR
jgi:hypothetical protein